MKGKVVLLVFVVGCRFDLPKVAVDAAADAAAEIDAPPVDGPAVGCRRPEYAPLSGGTPGHVYLKGTSAVLWSSADTGCVATGPRAYLAVPDAAGELTALRTLAGSTFWIGVHDRVTEGTYMRKPMDTMPMFLPWLPGGEPDNVGEQDCVTATATTISTEACDAAARVYLCECEP